MAKIGKKARQQLSRLIESAAAKKSKAAAPWKVGDAVRWTSQAGGVAKEKRGVVLARVPPGGNSLAYAKKLRSFSNLRVHFDDGERDHASFLVGVARPDPSELVDLYWPLVSKLKKD